MSDYWHGYFAIEDLSLPGTARADLIAALRELGPDSDPSPARLMQFRASLDGSKAIFEARFLKANLTIASLKTFISNAVGVVTPEQITHAAQQTAYGPLLTFAVGGTDYLRVLVFGDGIRDIDADARDETSRVAALVYIAANRADWEPQDGEA